MQNRKYEHWQLSIHRLFASEAFMVHKSGIAYNTLETTN